MRQILKRHPDTLSAGAAAVEAEAARAGSLLSLRFLVKGDPARLALPPPGRPERADGLWRHTCFEAFIRPGPGEAYAEFNLAPSRRWAAYGFTGYRHDMTPIAGIAAPSIAVETTAEGVMLDAVIETGLPARGAWRVGLSAVIEAADGTISYWALAHPPGKPDFHHADCFALELRETATS
jgi:hypothetical protein